VPEDWHRLSSHALMHRALRPSAGAAYRMDSSEVNLVFATPQRGLPSEGAIHPMAAMAGERDVLNSAHA
jgi:flagellar biosynthesis protein FlhF